MFLQQCFRFCVDVKMFVNHAKCDLIKLIWGDFVRGGFLEPNDLIVFNNKKFIDYVKDIYPSELNVEKANRLDDQADCLDLRFHIGNRNRLYTKLYDKHDNSTFILSTFHSSQVTYHLALHMGFAFLGLSSVPGAAHIMMTSDIFKNSHWTDSFLRAIK